MAKELTAREVETAQLPEGKYEHELYDGDNLILRLRKGAKKASKTWLFRYSSASGKRRKLTLGTYPALSLAEARELGLPTLLEEFEGLARMHFETEEALLAKNQCPTLEPHRVEHAFYLAQIASLRDQSPIPMQSLSSLLGAWIGEHLGGTDMNDKYYMQDRRNWVAQRAKAFGPIDV